MMDGIFEELITEGQVMVYLDNILIFTNTLEQYFTLTHMYWSVLIGTSLFCSPFL